MLMCSPSPVVRSDRARAPSRSDVIERRLRDVGATVSAAPKKRATMAHEAGPIPRILQHLGRLRSCEVAGVVATRIAVEDREKCTGPEAEAPSRGVGRRERVETFRQTDDQCFRVPHSGRVPPRKKTDLLLVIGRR